MRPTLANNGLVARWLAFALAIAMPFAAQAQAQVGPRVFTTGHQGMFGGQRMHYAATVEEFILNDAEGHEAASVFTTSYLRRDGGARPVIFAFNGGPGSASIWLHLGFLGPRRIDFDDPAAPRTVAPFAMMPNPDSPLDVADIVLIDPPGTGYSRILPGGKAEQFMGVEQDAKATVEVIRQWLHRHGRANSPKYLLSESYGTIRAAVVARLLAGGPTQTGRMEGITLNGVILLGQALDMARGAEGDDRTYTGLLPSMAATACHFRKVAADCTPEGQADAARRFIADEYLGALYRGDALPADRKASVARNLAALTGLREADVLEANLRVSAGLFGRLLLSGAGQRIGQYDARFTLPAAPSGDDPVADDPAMAQYVPGFVAAWQDYAREDLGVAIDRPYQAIAFREVNARWDYGYGPGVPHGRNYAVDLAIAMTRNSGLRLLVGTGLFDLVTPAGTAEYTLTHAGVPQRAMTVRTYPSGHMPYLGATARTALVRDIRAFVKEPQ